METLSMLTLVVKDKVIDGETSTTSRHLLYHMYNITDIQLYHYFVMPYKNSIPYIWFNIQLLVKIFIIHYVKRE